MKTMLRKRVDKKKKVLAPITQKIKELREKEAEEIEKLTKKSGRMITKK